MLTRANIKLIDVLRKTANRLNRGAVYNWCHMGRCNCGHLAQTITNFSAAEIHEMALMKAGDWSKQSVEHCTSTGYTLDHIIQIMLDLGLTRQDIVHIEHLSDQRVLHKIDQHTRMNMSHKNRDDVVLYMKTFAGILEEELFESLPEIQDLMRTSAAERV